jgi:hypothetical protein
MYCRISAALLLFTIAFAIEAQDTKYRAKNQLIPAPDCLTAKGAWQGGSVPCSAAIHEEWLKDIRHWRDERKIRIGYDGSRYALPALQWMQRSFIQPQMMVQDRYFYDPVAGRYTVDRYLADLEDRYGGIDSVLIWPTSSMRIRKARAHSASWIWWVTSDNGRTNWWMGTGAAVSCAAEATTSRKVPSGTSRRLIGTISTASCCSWRPATTDPRPSVFAASRMGSDFASPGHI